MTKPKKPFLRLDTVILRVKDIKKASNWYQQKLGFRATYADDNEKLVVFDLQGTTSLTLWQLKEKEKLINSSTYPIFLADDIHSAHETLASQKVKTEAITENGGVRWFSFYDPDGNRLEICQVA
jgi:catechol 2,3-dioxygenase-like lactoylglutathione lyase family enzyme